MTANFLPGAPGVYDSNIVKPFIDALPTEEEQYHSMITIVNLQNLNGFINDYIAAVALHSHVEQLRASFLNEWKENSLELNNNLNVLEAWNGMAGREAAMTLFHVGKSLVQIKANMRWTPTLRETVKSEILRSATNDMERAFPNYNLARHAASHRAESMGSLDKVAANSIELGDEKKFISGMVEGHEFIATIDKKLVRLPITIDAVNILKQIVANIYSAFPTLTKLLPPIQLDLENSNL